MKILKSFSFALLLLSLVTAFAFRTAHNSTAIFETQGFAIDPELTNPDPYDPNSYIPFPSGFDPDVDCPDADIVCAILVLTTELYANGQPKVDVLNTCINTRITETLQDHSKDGVPMTGDCAPTTVWLYVP